MAKKKDTFSADVLEGEDVFAKIKVIGLGGSGGNAVTRMVNARVKGVEFVSINTDAQALFHCSAPTKVHIGEQTTRGLGAGSDPELGRRSAEENKEDIYNVLKGADMVFLTCGLGGGTGSGGIPIIAEISRELGALTVAVVTLPFSFEGMRRRRVAEEALEELRGKVDSLIVIPNDRLLQMIDKKTSLQEAFSIVDDVLRSGVQGISDLITTHGLVNVDFADVKAIMAESGTALMSIGHGVGDNRTLEAAKMAVESPLLESTIDGARGILFNVTGGPDLSMYEVNEAARLITEEVDPEANIIFGAVIDEAMQGEVKITLVATGFEESTGKKKSSEAARKVAETLPKKEEEELDVPAFIRKKIKA